MFSLWLYVCEWCVCVHQCKQPPSTDTSRVKTLLPLCDPTVGYSILIPRHHHQIQFCHRSKSSNKFTRGHGHSVSDAACHSCDHHHHRLNDEYSKSSSNTESNGRGPTSCSRKQSAIQQFPHKRQKTKSTSSPRLPPPLLFFEIQKLHTNLVCVRTAILLSPTPQLPMNPTN